MFVGFDESSVEMEICSINVYIRKSFKKNLKINQLSTTVGNQIEIISSPKEDNKYKKFQTMKSIQKNKTQSQFLKRSTKSIFLAILRKQMMANLVTLEMKEGAFITIDTILVE